MKAIRFLFQLSMVLVLVASLWAIAPAVKTVSADTITVCASGCDYTTIQAAVNAANEGDEIIVYSGEYTLSNETDRVVINKPNITIRANSLTDKPLLLVEGSVGNAIRVLANGVSIEGLKIQKTDNINQNIIYVQADNFTFKDSEVFGKYVHDTPEVSRGFEVAYGSENLNISNNIFHHLRQVGYFNGSLASPTTGTIEGNYTYYTKGWVIDGANFSFIGNTWGVGVDANVFDIAILSATPSSYYPNLIAISNANNEAVIEDQRLSPPLLTVAFVDINSTYTLEDGGRLHPYKSLQNAVNRVMPGGKIYISNGVYSSSTINIYKSLTIAGESRSGVVIKAGAAGGYGLDIQANNFTIQNATIENNNGANFGLKISGSQNVTVRNVEARYFVRSGVDLIGCNNAIVENVYSHHNGGAGVAVSNSTNITLRDISTSNNVWGGVGLFTNAGYYTGNLSDGKTGLDGIILEGTNSFGEVNPLYLDYADPSHVIRNFVQSDFEYVVKSTIITQKISYQKTKESALDFINAADSLPPAGTFKSSAGIQRLSDGSFHVLNTMKIQPAIDLSNANGTIYIYPGTYNEIAQGRYVLGTNGPHQFGLFIADDKDGISLIGVDSTGSPIVDYTQVQATINTNATNNFGYSGIFVEADNVTLQGLRIGPNTPEDNKTIEVIGDGFVLRNSHIAVPAGGSVYINDWRFDEENQVSHVESYFIENNWFEDGSSVDIASGAGYSGDIQNRRITGNKFTGNEDVYWALVSFNGYGEIPWFEYPIGGAIVQNNDFSGSTQYIRARSNYDNSQFDWETFWEENTFDKAVVTLSDVDNFAVRSYEYTSGSYKFTNVRRIAGAIQGEINNAVAGDTILAKGGIFTEDVEITKAVTITGQNRPVMDGRFWVNANQVTIQGFEIRNGLASSGVDQSAIYISSGLQNIRIQNNHIIGTWTNENSSVINRGIEVSYHVNNLLVDGNVIEKWLSGIYLNPTTGQITVTNNEIRDNWAGAGTDGQTNVTFRNNYFIGNIEGIGASAVGASFVVEKNAFLNNTTALNHYDGLQIKAERNWWGHQSGPTITSNPGGSGQPVVGEVDFAPWLCEGTDSQPDVIGFQPVEDAAGCTTISEAKLVFTAYPTGGFEGVPFAVQPVVRAEDNEGNLAVNFNGVVILYLANNPAGGALQGSLLTNAVNGVATFSGVSINKAGENYQLAAIATSLDPAVGGFFNVLPQNADLAVSITATPNPVETGAALTYTVGVQNLGPLPASNLTLTVNLPAGVTYVNAGGTGWTCSQSGGVVTCTRFSLAAASSAPNVTVSVNAPNQAGSITATASINATTLDLVSGNNQASVDTLVVTIPETAGVTIYLPLVKK